MRTAGRGDRRGREGGQDAWGLPPVFSSPATPRGKAFIIMHFQAGSTSGRMEVWRAAIFTRRWERKGAGWGSRGVPQHALGLMGDSLGAAKRVPHAQELSTRCHSGQLTKL